MFNGYVSRLFTFWLCNATLYCVLYRRSRSRLRRTVQDRRSATANFNISPQFDPDPVNQDHFADPDPEQDSHSMDTDMDRHLMSIKQESDTVQTLEIKTEEREVYQTPEFISTGSQSGTKLQIIKIEYEEDTQRVSV